MRYRTWLIVLFLWLFTPVAWGLQFTSMEPGFGAEGDSITLYGIDFDPGAAYMVKVGQRTAVIEDVQADFLRFTIPPDASTGPVSVILDDTTTTHSSFLTITVADVTAQLNPSLPGFVSGYVIGTMYDETQSAGPNYPVEIAVGEVTYVIAAGEDTQPTVMAVATGNASTVTLSAESSALTMLFTTQSIFTIDPAAAELRLNLLAGLTETQVLADQVDAEIQAGNAYLESGVLDDALFNAVIAYLNAVAADPARIEPASLLAVNAEVMAEDFVNGALQFKTGYPKDLEVTGYEPLNSLVAKPLAGINNDRGVPTLGIKMERAPLTELNDFVQDQLGHKIDIRSSPLDTIANVYQLDTNAEALDSPLKVSMLEGEHTATYPRVRPGPLFKRMIKAKPAVGQIDVLGTLQDVIIETAYQSINSVVPGWVPPQDLRIASDHSGLYIIRSFSGARFPLQNSLIDPSLGLPGGRTEDLKMVAINIVTLANEALGILLKSEDIIGESELAQLMVKFEIEISTALERESTQGPINGQALLRLAPEMIKSLIKGVVGTLIKEYTKLGRLDKIPKAVGKIAISTLNITAKVAKVGKVVTRVGALTNIVNLTSDNAWMAHSVQSTLVIIGDPWRPEITSFFPQKGHRGRTVKISGRNFSTVAEDNIVLFGSLTTDPENAVGAIVATVVSSRSEALWVEVPEGAETGSITVAIKDKGSSSTTRLASPFKVFTVIEDPVITGIEPNPPLAGGLAVITGENFAKGSELNKLEYSATSLGTALDGGPSSLLIRVPNSVSPNSVKVIIAGRESNDYAFTAVIPPVPNTGANITVSTDTDGNIADGKLTLHEAFLIASGDLGRDLTRPPYPRPAELTYEADYVSGAPGASNRDTIKLRSSLSGGTITLTQSLPPLADFDIYDLDNYRMEDVTIDGSGIAETAVLINGKKMARLGGHFKNFSGHCVHLLGGATNNRITATVDTCGGDGLFLDTDVVNNVVQVNVSNSAANGIHLAGAGVILNEVKSFAFFSNEGVVSSGGYGVLVEAGASFNQFDLTNIRLNTSGGIRVTGAGTLFNSLEGNEVLNSGGPGIWIDTSSTHVNGFNIAGNDGDGVLIEGDTVQDVVLQSIASGYVYRGFVMGEAHPNLGSGVRIRNGASNITLHSVYAGGNRDHGIWLDGPGISTVNVTNSSIGRVNILNSPYQVVLGNGKSGVAITGGAHNNIIGPAITDYFTNTRGVYITSHVNLGDDSGAGILLTGAGTRDNIIYGNVIGSDGGSLGLGNRYGIRIRDGAHSNTIGLRGDNGTTTSPPMFQTYNLIQSSIEAGILLESGGSLPNESTLPGAPPLTPTGGNVIQNNFFGRHQRFVYDVLPNHVGILIREGGVANRIGGSEPGEANYIRSNDRAGIEIQGGALNRPELANRIIGNVIQAQGSELPFICDPLTGVPEGVGVLVSGGASGHIIGGTGAGESNKIGARKSGTSNVGGNRVGIYIDGSSKIQVAGNDLGYNKVDRGNICAGIIIREGTDNFIGPDNRFDENTTYDADESMASLVVAGGSGNKILGNWFGSPTDYLPNSGTARNHISILDSADNQVGDTGAARRNVIIRAGLYGILIDGVGSTGNKVQGNMIGVAPTDGRYSKSNYKGVLLSGGASGNTIGGESTVMVGNRKFAVPAGNKIHGNRDVGVMVDGAGTLGNKITNNSISNHSVNDSAPHPGIENINGGNAEVPPPQITSFDGFTVKGTVNAPDGSLVQIFTDPDDEGYQLMAEATVSGGAFSAVAGLWVFPNICATVTHGNDNTSEFLCGVADPPAGLFGLDIRRVDNPSGNTNIQAGRSGVSVAMKLSTGEGSVAVQSMTFAALGSIDESTELTGLSLYLDQDQDGALTFGDVLLRGGATFSVNDGEATFESLNLIIPGDSVEHWLLVAELDASATLGGTVEFQLLNNAKVDSAGVFPSTIIVETGAFPVNSDVATVVAQQPTAEEIKQAIISGAGYQAAMDINGDGVVDVADVVIAERSGSF